MSHERARAGGAHASHDHPRLRLRLRRTVQLRDLAAATWSAWCRPNFFCGQLLTDADLTAASSGPGGASRCRAIATAGASSAACDVSCAPHGGRAAAVAIPSRGPVVYVNPGYAVDCCGNDLVVCEPLPVDLGDVCRPEDDPCAPPEPRRGRRQKARSVAAAVRRTGAKACWDRLKDGVFAVDLSLRYHEDLSHGTARTLAGAAAMMPAASTRGSSNAPACMPNR